MYRVLIVDDEALIRRGIKNSVNWNELGIEMVAEAADGVEALSQVIENVPDIVLLDINMPRMNGLDFANIVKKQYPNISIIIITGYSDFEYARSALRAGVDDYILKPVTKERIAEIIKSQLNTIEERKLNGMAQSYSERDAAAGILNSVLRGDAMAEAEIPRLCSMLDWKPQSKVFFAIIRDYLSSCELWNDGHADSLAHFSILNIAGEILEPHACGLSFTTYRGEMALVMNCTRGKCQELLQKIEYNVLSFLEIPIDTAVSGIGNIDELAALREQALEGLDYAFALSGKGVIFYDEIKKFKGEEVHYPVNTEKELLAQMYSGDMEKSLELIERFFDEISSQYPSVSQCRNVLLRLIMKISGTMESVSTRSGEALVKPIDPLAVLDSFQTLEDARLWVKKVYGDTYTYLAGMKSRSKQLYYKIKAYIEDNYNDCSLNLKKCSEDIFLSSNYISMILKKETGKAFVDCLNEYRIERARELLSAPNSKVYEVSTHVGFTHPTYFSSVFKKITGKTPSQYTL